MKLTRSRFRLVSLLAACLFLLTAVLCAVSALRRAGVTLPSPGFVPAPVSSPAPADDPALHTETEEAPVPSASPEASANPEMTTPAEQEYNLYGL